MYAAPFTSLHSAPNQNTLAKIFEMQIRRSQDSCCQSLLSNIQTWAGDVPHYTLPFYVLTNKSMNSVCKVAHCDFKLHLTILAQFCSVYPDYFTFAYILTITYKLHLKYRHIMDRKYIDQIGTHLSKHDIHTKKPPIKIN